MLCSKCKRDLPEANFCVEPKNTVRRWNCWCKDCQRRANLERRLRAKAQLVEIMGGKCMKCSGVFPPAAYDFHHTDPTQKEDNIGNLLRKSLTQAMSELRKTVMWCANCHRSFHAEEAEVRNAAA